MTVKTTSQSWLARQGSPEVFITYRTYGHRRLFRPKKPPARPLSRLFRPIFGTSSPAAALTRGLPLAAGPLGQQSRPPQDGANLGHPPSVSAQRRASERDRERLLQGV